MWIFDSTSGELKEQDEDQGVDLGGGAVSSGGSPVNPGTAPTSSGNFTSINKYLTQNQPQSEGLGQKVAGQIQANTDAAGSALSQGESEFNQKISEAGPALTQEQIQGAAANPYEFAQNTTNVDQFKKTLQGNYEGPNSFSDVSNYQDLRNKVSGAANAAEQVKTTGGREELIKNAYSRPERAKQGMLSLDEALLKQTPTALAPVQEKATQANALNDRITSIENSASGAVAGKKKEVQDRAKSIEDSFLGDAGTYNRLKQGIDERVGKVSSQAEQERDEAKNYLDLDWLKKNGALVDTESKLGTYPTVGKVNISDAALNQLGITRDQYVDLLTKQARSMQNRGGLEPSGMNVLDNFNDYASYSTPELSGIGRGNVATSDEYNELSALSSLLGDRVDPKYIDTPDQAGKYNSDLTDFNYQKLIDYLNKQNSFADSVSGVPALGGR